MVCVSFCFSKNLLLVNKKTLYQNSPLVCVGRHLQQNLAHRRPTQQPVHRVRSRVQPHRHGGVHKGGQSAGLHVGKHAFARACDRGAGGTAPHIPTTIRPSCRWTRPRAQKSWSSGGRPGAAGVEGE